MGRIFASKFRRGRGGGGYFRESLFYFIFYVFWGEGLLSEFYGISLF